MVLLRLLFHLAIQNKRAANKTIPKTMPTPIRMTTAMYGSLTLFFFWETLLVGETRPFGLSSKAIDKVGGEELSLELKSTFTSMPLLGDIRMVTLV